MPSCYAPARSRLCRLSTLQGGTARRCTRTHHHSALAGASSTACMWHYNVGRQILPLRETVYNFRRIQSCAGCTRRSAARALFRVQPKTSSWIIKAHQSNDSSPGSVATSNEPAPPTPSSTTSTPSPAAVARESALNSGLFSTPQQQSAGFLALTAASLAFGVGALATPDLLLSVALGGQHGALDAAFTRIAGATMLISAAVEYSLQDAVNAGHLKSATYQRLLLAVLVKDVMYLAAFALSPALCSPLLFAIYPGSAGASLVITLATLRSAFQQSGASTVSEGVKAAVGGLSLPKTVAARIYSVFILLYLATVAACYAPEVIFTGEPLSAAGELLKHTWAPGFLLAAAACWVLSDAADRNRLAASTFRRLNLGLGGVEAGYSAVFAWSIATGLAVNDISSWSNLAGSVVIMKYCFSEYFSNVQSKE